MTIKTVFLIGTIGLLQSYYNLSYCCECMCSYDYESRYGGLQNYCDKEPLKKRQRLTLYDIETSKGLSR